MLRTLPSKKQMTNPAKLMVALAIVLLPVYAAAEDLVLLKPPPEFSQYHLSPIRLEPDRFSKQVIVVQWRRTSVGEKSGSLSGMTKSGQLQVMGFSNLNRDLGTEKLSELFSGFGRNKQPDIALWVQASAYGNKRFVLSNIVRSGNPKAVPAVRAMTAAELAEYREHVRVSSPPEQLPPRYVLVRSANVLRPGAMVKAAHRGEWGDAEVLAIDRQIGATVRLIDHGDQILMLPVQKWLAVPASGPKIRPGGPSINVLPGTTSPLEAGEQMLNQVSKAVPGIPVRFGHHRRAQDGILMNVVGSMAKVRYSFAGRSKDEQVPIHQVVVSANTISQLKQPGAAKNYAKNLAEDAARILRLRVKDYPLRKGVPATHVQLPADVTVPAGTTLQASWGARLYDVSALIDSSDGPVPVRWAKYGEAWDCKITREQLLVDPETMQRLRGGQSKRKPARRVANRPDKLPDNPPDKKTRTWTDKSGKFSVQAEFVSLEDETVTLQNEAGKQIKIPLLKLQDKDQQTARKLQEAKASENPFEFVD